MTGERAPVSNRMYLPPANLPEHWLMCHTARRFRAVVSSYMGGILENKPVATVPAPINTEFEIKKVVEDVDGIARGGNWCVTEDRS